MIKCTLVILSAILLTSCRTNTALPPNPPGLKPHFAAKSQPAVLSRRALSEALPGFMITNVILANGQVTVSWQNGSPPFQVEGEPSLNGPWSTVGPTTVRHSASFDPEFLNFFRIQGAINLLNITSTNPTTLNWTPPQLDMSDTLTDNKIQRRYDQPITGNGLAPDDDTGWTDLATVPAGQDYIDTGSGADPAVHPLIVYREREVTGNGVFIPVGPTSVSGTPPPTPGKMNWLAVAEGSTASGNAVVYSVAADSAGNTFSGGSFQATVNLGLGNVSSNAGSQDAWLAKYNSLGVPQWVIHFGSTGADSIYGVAVDSAGNIIAVGGFHATVDVSGGSNPGLGTLTADAANYDMFIAKYAPDGSLLWASRFGGAFNDYIAAVSIDSSDNIIIAAKSQGGSAGEGHNIDMGNGHVLNFSPGSGGYLAILAKFSQGSAGIPGLCQWAQVFGGNGNWAEPVAMALDANGNAAVVGIVIGSADMGGGVGSGTAFAMKYSNISGAALWNTPHIYSSTSDIELNGVAVDPVTGNVYLVGKFVGTVDVGGGNITSGSGGAATTMLLIAFDASGTWIYQKKWGGDQVGNPDNAQAVVMDASGNLALTGIFNSFMDFNRDGIEDAAGSGYFVAVFTVVGNNQPVFRWAKRDQSGQGHGIGNTVALDSTHATVGGTFTSSFNPGGIAATPSQGPAGFTAQYVK